MTETTATFKALYNKLRLAGSSTIGNGSTSNNFGYVAGFLVWSGTRKLWLHGGEPVT